ncbi:uncharacterized protein LOC141859710 [Acropora palmata]|uniref:uncharacterized protein LOC141859710 n=1 Tax=Acropora palmata TaxID=6131 RepID=UPI003DA0CD0C
MAMQRPTLPAVFKVFSPILMLYFHVYSEGLQLILKSDNCVKSIEGVSLLKHSYKSFLEQDLFKCYQQCKVDNFCQSINFYKDRNFCQLNNRTQSERFQRALVPNLNAYYMDNPRRAFLGTSPLLAAISCQEIKDSSLGLAPDDRYWLFSEGPGSKSVEVYCDMERAAVITCTGHPCKNGGSCEYHGNDVFSCKCPLGYSGRHCEIDVNECSSNPCLNDGTCIDLVHGFNCTCPHNFTGIRCELGLGSECNSYFVNQETDRSVTYMTGSSAYKCDRNLAAGWYRFNSTAGSKMPTYCIEKKRCNTHASGWLNGTHPTSQEGIVNRTVCFNWKSKCCNWQKSIRVRNCGLFFVYYLTKASICYLRYCVTN